MSEFYVYVNSDAGYAKIHRASCQHCNNGMGKLGAPVAPLDQFIAASSFVEAQNRSRTLRYQASSCKDCNLDSD